MEPEFGELEYHLDDRLIVVEQVPMMVCKTCGQRLVPGPVGVTISELVQKAAQGIQEAESLSNRVGTMDRVTLRYKERVPAPA